MGKKCFIPNCTSGYDSNKDKIAIFSAPKDEITFKKWQKVIPRKDRFFTKTDYVCEKHFKSDDIISEWSDGLNTIPLSRRRLKSEVFPTLFPNCPKYLSTEVKKRRIIIKHEIPTKKIALLNNNCSVQNTQELENNEFATDKPLTFGNAGPSKTIFDLIWRREISIKLPNEFCTMHRINDSENSMYIIFTFLAISTNKIAYVEKQILFDETLNISLLLHNLRYANNDFPKVADTLIQLENLLDSVNDMVICKGMPICSEEANYSKVSKYDNISNSLRHNDCTLTVNSGDTCKYCKSLRANLCKRKRRLLCNKIIKTSKLQIQRKRNFRLRKKVFQLTAELRALKDKIAEVNMIDLNNKLKELEIPSTQQLLIKQCIEICKTKNKKSIRYNSDWLIICLLLHIKNANTYRFLRENNIVPLPCPRTIRRYLSRMKINCGLDEEFFELFKLKLDKKNEFNRRGLLLFDEMSVKKDITVNVRNMKLQGLEDFGNVKKASTTDTIADHALVFMFVPLADNYCQPVCFFASCGPTKANILSILIIQIIRKLEACNARVDGIICDGESTNRKMWTSFGITGKINNIVNKIKHPVDEDRFLYFFSDTPHLVKCIRNRLLDTDLQTPDGKVSWKFYENLYNNEKCLPGSLKVCPKITVNYIYPSKMQKMKVKLSTQVFSNSMVHGLQFYSNENATWALDSEATVKFTKVINDVFDALNTKTPIEGIRKNSSGLEICKNFLKWLDQWEKMVIDNKIDKNNFLTYSTVEGLRVTITSTLEICDYLLSTCNFYYVLTSKLNQDALESSVTNPNLNKFYLAKITSNMASSTNRLKT